MSIPAGSFTILPLKNTVIYPGVTQALKVGRDKSMKAVDLAKEKNITISFSRAVFRGFGGSPGLKPEA